MCGAYSTKSCNAQTEIARRIAKLSQAPFIKVEATKFTEVGFHGKDVDQIIKDLVDISITMTRKRIREVGQHCLDESVSLFYHRKSWWKLQREWKI